VTLSLEEKGFSFARRVIPPSNRLFPVAKEEGDILMDEEILPGFSLPVEDIFRE